MDSPFPRPLTEREAEVLEFLLSAEFAGRAALAAQAQSVRVTEQWPGEATIDLGVLDPDAPIADVVARVPVETSTADDAFGVLLHVVEGRLHTLEVCGMAVTELPLEFPPISALRPPASPPFA